MKMSILMLSAAAVCLIAGVIVNELPGVLLTTVTNVLALTAVVRETRSLRREKQSEIEGGK